MRRALPILLTASIAALAVAALMTTRTAASRFAKNDLRPLPSRPQAVPTIAPAPLHLADPAPFTLRTSPIPVAATVATAGAAVDLYTGLPGGSRIPGIGFPEMTPSQFPDRLPHGRQVFADIVRKRATPPFGAAMRGAVNITASAIHAPAFSTRPIAAPLEFAAQPPAAASAESANGAQQNTPRISVLAANNGQISFTNAIYVVQESSGTVNAAITVQRVGGSTGAVGATVATVAGGTATAGADYTAATTVLSWADGDATAKTFTVPVLTDLIPEGNETISLALSLPTGGATLGTQSTSTLTITDRPFDAWRATYFGVGNIAANTLPTADFDGDGRPNLLEYALATNPTLAQPGPGYVVDSQSASNMTLSFTRSLNMTGLTLRILTSDTMAAGSWTAIATKVGAAAWTTAAGASVTDNSATGAVVVTDAVTTASRRTRFLRVAADLDGYAYAALRIANSEEKVRSKKRGVAMNTMSAADFRALAPGVSWYYNWSASPGSSVPPSDAKMTFVPMLWDENSSTTALKNYLASANPKPPVVLAINEPNLKGQAFITPQQTAATFKSAQTIANTYGIPTVGPHMATGSATADSITAFDPIQNTTLTYTSMTDFLDATLYYTNQAGTQVPALGLHCYDNAGAVKYFADLFNTRYQRPVWVTEFAYAAAATTTDARDYIIQATDYLERTSNVAGYAFFKERSTNANYSLLVYSGASGVLTTLGQYYIAVPPHDSDLYYRLPGRIQAENYVTLANADIRATTDTDGTFDITLSSGAIVGYNLLVETAGTYVVRLRMFGPGTATLRKNGAILGTATTTASGWQTISMTVTLAAGPQTLEVRRSSSVSAINWLEFQLQ